MHSKSNNAEINEWYWKKWCYKWTFWIFFKKITRRIRKRKKKKKKKKDSNFVFESVNLLYYSLHEIILNRGGSYIDSHSWIKHKRATINPKSKDDKCFRDATIASLNHKKIENYPEGVSNPLSLI